MYDILFVRRRRRRKVAALVAAFSSIGVTSFVIISFLGRTVGTFTVSLNNSEVNLALSETLNSNKNSTFLRVNEDAKYVEYTYDSLKYRAAELDDEDTPYNKGEYEYEYLDKNDGKMKKAKGLEFFKYTFYVKNIGNKTATYKLRISIDDRTRADDNSGRSLDDTLRVMVFENKPNSDEHNYLVYAKKAVKNNYNIKGDPVPNEFIVTDDTKPNRETEDYPLAETFKDGSTVAEYEVNNFIKNEMMRYTIVFWLEGGDPQSIPVEDYPEGATLKLGVDITAHENSES